MSWYDYLNPVKDAEWLTGTGSEDPTNQSRDNLNQVGSAATNFANQGATNYANDTAQGQQTINDLRDLVSGKNSVSTLQLQQGQQANQAQQMSMAAGASPNNQAMAARTAMMNAGRIGYGLAGQQAMAGLQERNQATSQLANFLSNTRGQDINAATGGYGAANTAYGQQIANPQKTTGQQLLNAGVGLAAAAATKSDRRAKEDIEDGDSAANETLKGLRSYAYKYKDERDGKGKQFGVMAQDLEKTSLKSAVIDTPKGKYVDGGKAALGSLALVGALARRVEKLEGSRK